MLSNALALSWRIFGTLIFTLLLLSSVFAQSSIPQAPIALAATDIGQYGFTANWTPVAGATNYFIDVAFDSSFSYYGGFPFTHYSTGNVSSLSIDFNSYINKGHIKLTNTRYYYRVQATNDLYTSGSSNSVSVLTLSENPNAGIIPLASYQPAAVEINWSLRDLDPSLQFFIDVAKDTGFTKMVAPYNNFQIENQTISIDVHPPVQSIITYTLKNLTDTTYYFRVRSANAAGASGNSNVQTISPYFYPPVAKIATQVTDLSFVANWESVKDVGNYELDVWSDDILGGIDYNHNPSGLSTNIEVCCDATVFKYRVRSRFTDGSTTNYSNVIEVITLVTGLNSPQEPITLYPNPAHNFIFINGIGNVVTEPVVIDMVGRYTVIKSEKQQDLLRVDISNLPCGMYLLRVTDINVVHHIKFLKQ